MVEPDCKRRRIGEDAGRVMTLKDCRAVKSMYENALLRPVFRAAALGLLSAHNKAHRAGVISMYDVDVLASDMQLRFEYLSPKSRVTLLQYAQMHVRRLPALRRRASRRLCLLRPRPPPSAPALCHRRSSWNRISLWMQASGRR